MSMSYGGYEQAPVAGYTGKVSWNWLGESWQLFAANAGIWVAAAFIYGIIIFGLVFGFEFAYLFPLIQKTPAPTQAQILASLPWVGIVVMYVVVIALELFAMASMMRMAVKSVKREMLSMSDAFSGAPYMMHFLLLGIILFLMNCPITIVYFAVFFRQTMMQSQAMVQNPTHFVASIFGFYAVAFVWMGILYSLLMPSFAMVADGVAGHKAAAASIKAMSRQLGMAFLFLFAIGLLLTLASVLTCDLGFLATVPMACIISALAYRDMLGMPGIRQPVYAGAPGGPYPPGAWPPPTGTWPPPPNQQPPTGYGQPQGQWPPSTPTAPPQGQWPPSTPPGPPQGKWPPSTPPGPPQGQWPPSTPGPGGAQPPSDPESGG